MGYINKKIAEIVMIEMKQIEVKILEEYRKKQKENQEMLMEKVKEFGEAIKQAVKEEVETQWKKIQETKS